MTGVPAAAGPASAWPYPDAATSAAPRCARRPPDSMTRFGGGCGEGRDSILPARRARAQGGAARRERDRGQCRRRQERPCAPGPPPAVPASPASRVPAESHPRPPCASWLLYRRRRGCRPITVFAYRLRARFSAGFSVIWGLAWCLLVVMRTPAGADPDLATVVAAQRGDMDALDALAAGYLPLVYNIVGRAMNGHPDVDDVVQETMLRAVRGIGELRDPAAFRSWLVAIAIRQVRDSYRDRLARPPAVEFDAPVPDFADQTIERLGLSGQRLQTAEATRWLDDDDRPVLALWWQEAARQLTRAELAAGLGLTQAHAAVRVARMKERLAASRMVVHALSRAPAVREPRRHHGRVGRRAEPAVAQAAGKARQGLHVVPGRRRHDPGRAAARRAAAARGPGRPGRPGAQPGIRRPVRRARDGGPAVQHAQAAAAGYTGFAPPGTPSTRGCCRRAPSPCSRS